MHLYLVTNIACFWRLAWENDDGDDPPDLEEGDLVIGLGEPIRVDTGEPDDDSVLEKGHWEMRVFSRLGPGWINVNRIVGVVP